MGYYPKDIGLFTFSASESNYLQYVDDCEGITIFATTSSGVFTVQVSNVDTTSTGAGTFVDLQSAGSDVTLTAVNAAVISPCPFRRIRLLSTFGSTGSTGAVTGAGGTGFPVTGVIVV